MVLIVSEIRKIFERLTFFTMKWIVLFGGLRVVEMETLKIVAYEKNEKQFC